ncbi:hypothetical protein FOL47_000305 [Perkinsus chesapeaki]|uniref:Peptidase A1 domain-containing protein n=1 Tax=Perkinsus chesapeaki TaxID=330153 RepID=A0A7J6MMQ2_PERCH|nr:hypothetical protein FOL47_000305 [Perkinsus chesapeaki]
MDQLQGKVASRTFAMYLRSSSSPGTTPKGELLLGGGDPRIYVSPLYFVPLLSQQEYLVTMDTLQVSGETKRTGLNKPILIDTGGQGMVFPRRFADGFVNDISKQASKKAGTTVRITYDPELGTYEFACAYISFFPLLLIGLGRGGSVTLTVAGKYYTRSNEGFCTVAITPTTEDEWVLPDFVIIDRYVEFQPTQRRIGFANLL